MRVGVGLRSHVVETLGQVNVLRSETGTIERKRVEAATDPFQAQAFLVHVRQIEHGLWILALIRSVLVLRGGRFVVLLGAVATRERETKTCEVPNTLQVTD